jgi:hypothetical protein
MLIERLRKGLMMSGVRAVPGSAEARLPAKPHATPKHDGDDRPLPRRPRKRKPSEPEMAEPEAHQLDVEA